MIFTVYVFFIYMYEPIHKCFTKLISKSLMELFPECIFGSFFCRDLANEIARCAHSMTTAARDGNCVTLLINNLLYILHLAVLIPFFLLILLC